MIGPGKYDSALRVMLNQLSADAGILIVLEGEDGSGISLAVNESRISADLVLSQTPAVLRALADSIEGDFAELMAGPKGQQS